MKIFELKGNAHVFTQKDGKTFRIFAREGKELDESLISDEMKIAERMGLIMISSVVPTEVMEVSKNTKKSGGTK